MSVDLIQATYADLDQVAKRFGKASSAIEKMTREVARGVECLESGGWKGMSAEAFYKEMNQVAMPALARLTMALNEGRDTTKRISELVQAAEADAAQPFQNGNGFGYTSAASGKPGFDGVEGGKNTKYAPFKGTPFVKGAGDASNVHPNDVRQGQLGDCYLMAAMASVAERDPDTLKRMIRDNGDGTYTVTLYRKAEWYEFGQFKPVEIRVNGEFPAQDGKPAFARLGDSVGGQQELWPMLIEKAYAQSKGGYDKIQGGSMASALEALTGRASESHMPGDVSLGWLTDLRDNGAMIGVGTFDNPMKQVKDPALYKNGTLVPDHAYYVTNVDAVTKEVTLKNPWGWEHGEIKMSYDQFKSSFETVMVNAP